MPRAQPDDDLRQEAGNAGANGRSDPLVLLHERLRFETMLSRLSTTFINLQATEVDGHIERGLGLIVDYLDLDRSTLLQFSDDGRELLATHCYARPAFPPVPRQNLTTQIPWYTRKLREGELLRFVALPEELPPEAAHERILPAEPHAPLPPGHPFQGR